MFFKGDEFLCQAYKKLNKILEKLFNSTDDLQGQITSNKANIENKLETHKKSKDHPAENVTYKGKINKDNVKEALDDTKERIDNIVGQGGSDNTEVVDARHSTVKDKTFPVLGERMEEIENDMLEPNSMEVTSDGPIISMPDNALDGQVFMNIKGNTITNLAGLSGRGLNSPKDEILINQGTVENGVLELISDGQNYKNFRICANLKEGVTYTYIVEVIENTLNVNFALLQSNVGGSVKYLKPNETGLIKFTFEAGKEDKQAKLDMITLYLNPQNTEGTKVKFKNLMILEGDYTDREVNYIEGTKSVPASFRVKSVGKNLFDGEWWNGYNDIIKPTPNAISFTNLIRGEKNESYRFSYEFVDNTGIVMARTYDSNKKMIRSFVSNLVTLQGSEVYFEFHIYNSSGISPTNIKNAQVEKGRDVTNYKPYREDMSYVLATEDEKIVTLNKVDDVVDEFNSSDKTIIKKTNEIPLSKDDNWSLSRSDLTSVYAFSLNLNDANSMAKGILILNGMRFEFIQNWHLDEEHFYITSQGNVVVYVKKSTIDSQEGSTTTAKFKNWIKEGILIYELENERTIPVRWEGISGFENGTVYVDTIIPQIGYPYISSGLPTSFPDYKIGDIVSIYEVNTENGVKTPVEKTRVTVGPTLREKIWVKDMPDGTLLDWDYAPYELYPYPQIGMEVSTNISSSVKSLLKDSQVKKEVIRQLSSELKGHERDLSIHTSQQEKDTLNKSIRVTSQGLANHVLNSNNPHNTDKAQVGLGNVDNVKQATKSEFIEHINGIFHLVESGSNANGSYMKFADGTAICYTRLELTYQTENYLALPGNAYWNYPIVYKSTPIVLVSKEAHWSHHRMIRSTAAATPNLDDAMVRLYSESSSPFQSGDTYNVYVISIGKWK